MVNKNGKKGARVRMTLQDKIIKRVMLIVMPYKSKSKKKSKMDS